MQSEPLVLRYRLTPEMSLDAMMAIGEAVAGQAAYGGPGPWVKVAGWFGLVGLIVLCLRTLYDRPIILLTVGMLAGVVVGVASFMNVVRRSTRAAYLGIAERAAAEGEYWLEIGEHHIREETSEGLRQVTIRQIDSVLRIPEASVLLANGFGFVVPDVALPEGMSPERLKELVLWWREE
ncbi:hypothetical protein [Sagittula sp. S175]|uniref:hypothetical protein n=1 Tax=Sagittula sp. S175 TaxID=3415129 RepID=UPI003C7E6C4B